MMFSCSFVCASGIYIISNKPKRFSDFINQVFFKKKQQSVDTEDSSTEVTLDSETNQESLLRGSNKKMFERFSEFDQDQIKLVF